MATLRDSKKRTGGPILPENERQKLEEFSNRMSSKYGVSKNGPMSEKLIDLILRLRSLDQK